jgi:hypothetical protein
MTVVLPEQLCFSRARTGRRPATRGGSGAVTDTPATRPRADSVAPLAMLA